MIEQILQADRYLQVDQVPQARQLYQRVVDLDPGNGIAVVGLARCALAEGDDRVAWELASRALRIDPENDMARRMEARLAEILAERGEPVRGAAAVSAAPAARPTPAPATMRASAASAAPASIPPASTGPAAATSRKELAVRKSLVDRLLGR